MQIPINANGEMAIYGHDNAVQAKDPISGLPLYWSPIFDKPTTTPPSVITEESCVYESTVHKVKLSLIPNTDYILKIIVDIAAKIVTISINNVVIMILDFFRFKSPNNIEYSWFCSTPFLNVDYFTITDLSTPGNSSPMSIEWTADKLYLKNVVEGNI